MRRVVKVVPSTILELKHERMFFNERIVMYMRSCVFRIIWSCFEGELSACGPCDWDRPSILACHMN